MVAGTKKGGTTSIINWLVANHKSGGTMTYPDMSHIHVDVGQHFVSLAGGRKYASHNTRSSSRRYAEGPSRYDRGYSRASYDEPRYSGRSRRNTRQASYERGYSSGNGSGMGHYSGGYATMYR